MSLFDKWFAVEETSVDSDLTECHQVVSFAREPYFDRLIAFLDREADKPLEIGDQVAMIRSAARINAFKEIKAHLKKQIRDATEVISRESSNE